MIPQAFTSRDMSEAYKWLQTLPSSIKDEIKSMEQVVSLYLRAKRLGGAMPTKEELSQYVSPSATASLENSKSSQEFQKTLKSLRHELEQFDFAGQAPALEPHPTETILHSSGTPSQSHQISGSHQNQTQSQPPQQAVLPTAPQANLLSALRLDPRSRQIVNEIREGLNLSSDVEVIRLSLVLAQKNLKDLLTK